MAIPSRSIDQIKGRDGSQNAHANRKRNRSPRMRHEDTMKDAAIMGLSLEIIPARLDILVVRFHITPSLPRASHRTILSEKQGLPVS
jgi:hypothetical protein